MKRMCMVCLTAAAMLGAGCHGKNASSTETAGTSGRSESVPSADRSFVQDISQMNAAAIDLSRLAAEKAQSADVKHFAQMVVDEHTAVGEKLDGVATQTGIETRYELDSKDRSRHDTLAAKQGLDFDKDYIDAMLDGHDKFVDTLASRVDKTTVDKWKDQVGKEPDIDKAKADIKAGTVLPEKSDNDVTQRVNAWAADTYPAAYTHLLEAKTLKDTLKKRVTD